MRNAALTKMHFGCVIIREKKTEKCEKPWEILFHMR